MKYIPLRNDGLQNSDNKTFEQIHSLHQKFLTIKNYLIIFILYF